MNKTLIAYFSATGNTKAIAQTMFEIIKDADIFEIKPATPYSAADLDWQNPQSRSSMEMKDENSRPGIADRVKDMGLYKTIFLGFPIWWYTTPHIVLTFLDDYELAGKIIIPFATSGSSGMGKIPDFLENKYPRAHWEHGKRFAPGTDRNEIEKWISEHVGWKK